MSLSPKLVGWLTILFSLVVTAQSRWAGCNDPNVGDGESIQLVKIGEPTTICLALGPSGDWGAGATYVRYVFQPEADEYSRFHIPRSYAQLVNNQGGPGPLLPGTNITVHVSSQKSLSFLRIYHDVKQFRVYPFLTAIIDVDGGVVQGIAWDNACVFCPPDRCAENMFNFEGVPSTELEGVRDPSKGCYFTQEQCNKIIADGGNECDVTLYVVWTGTDASGSQFQSSAKRFSAFPAKRLQDRLLGQFTDLL